VTLNKRALAAGGAHLSDLERESQALGLTPPVESTSLDFTRLWVSLNKFQEGSKLWGERGYLK